MNEVKPHFCVRMYVMFIFASAEGHLIDRKMLISLQIHFIITFRKLSLLKTNNAHVRKKGPIIRVLSEQGKYVFEVQYVLKVVGCAEKHFS